MNIGKEQREILRVTSIFVYQDTDISYNNQALAH